MSSFSSDLQNANPKLLRRIQRACRPTLSQLDLALNLEICDLINEKQGALPRHAAIVTVKLINSRDPQVSELLVQLLDILVKNCGYPFHLQISRKEFLNELVKRFPERPPPRYSRTQRLILGLIEEWTQTLCKTSRYKSDLGFIRDMRRLLAYKGYIFPELKKEDAAVLNPSDNLKSIEEIQKEEKILQSAKLQELIRRGRPQDLKEANKLMKIMSGFKDEEVLELTKQKVAEDINKLKRKCDLFEEMVNNASNLGTIDSSDSTITDLYASLKVLQPKVLKIIEEENDDLEAVTDLLLLNDRIHTLLNRYIALKGGEPLPAPSGGSSAGGDLLNLIDFDDNDSPPPLNSADNGNSAGSANDLVDLLGDLNFTSTSSANQGASSQQLLFGMGGSIALETSPPPPLVPISPLGVPAASPVALAPAAAPAQSQGLDPFQFDFGSPSPTPSSLATPASIPGNILVHQSQYIKFEFIKMSASDSKISLKASYSNLTLSAISSLQVMLAVPKSWELQLMPQSGSFLGGLTNNGINQFVNLTKKQETNKQLKIKWKLNYIVNGSNMEETGVVLI